MRRSFLFFFLLFFGFDRALAAQSVNLNAEYRRLQAEIESRPDDLGVKMDLAYLFSQGLEFARSIALYEEVTAKDPANLRAWVELCALRTMVRDAAKAEGACSKAVDLAPDDALMHDNLGLSYFKFGNFRQSLKPFLEALTLNPRATLAKTHVAQAFLALREPRTAKTYYEEILAEGGLSDDEKALIHYGIFLADKALKDDDHAFTAILETYKLSANPLYLGKVVATFMRRHQGVFFFLIGGIILSAAGYLGKRLNRFLKNED
jgi:tetratricopeptide (TPR) repeat protein